MNALTFNGNILNTVNNNDGQFWLTSADLAIALGYKSARSITNLYNANSKELTDKMTEVIESVTSSKTKGLKTKIRIFSLRGCHLIAMFARTAIAKDFRAWVLDILDRETANPVPLLTTKDDRTPLKNAVNLLVGKTNLTYPEAYNMVHQYMGVTSITGIPKERLIEAVEYIHGLILRVDPKSTENTNFSHNEYLKTVQHQIMDYVWDLQGTIKSLGGELPNYPEFDKEKICQMFVVSMLQQNRMVLSFGHNNEPAITFVPNDHYIVTDENVAGIIEHAISRNRLPDIMNAALKRAGR